MGLLLFLLPIVAYAIWWQASGRPVLTPSRGLLLGLAVLISGGMGFALWYGFDRSLDAGLRYVPAVLTPQ